jgi:hypothetical protein
MNDIYAFSVCYISKNIYFSKLVAVLYEIVINVFGKNFKLFISRAFHLNHFNIHSLCQK